MNPEDHVVPERKEVQESKTEHTHNDGSMLKKQRNQLKEVPMTKVGAI